MATIGLCKPYYAIYAASGTTVTYSSGGWLGKAVELTMDLDTADDNILYADNAPAESESTFSGGSLTITTDDLLPAAVGAVLGVTPSTVSVTGVSTTATELIFGETQVVPYCGFGVVVKKRQGGSNKWLGVVWPKVQFSNPGISATTQGDAIEWQTPEISANIMRDDTADHNWCRQALLDSETEAVAYIQGLLTTT